MLILEKNLARRVAHLQNQMFGIGQQSGIYIFLPVLPTKLSFKTLSSYSTVRGSFKRGLKRFESAKSLWSVNPIFDKACVRINWNFDV